MTLETREDLMRGLMHTATLPAMQESVEKILRYEGIDHYFLVYAPSSAPDPQSLPWIHNFPPRWKKGAAEIMGSAVMAQWPQAVQPLFFVPPFRKGDKGKNAAFDGMCSGVFFPLCPTIHFSKIGFGMTSYQEINAFEKQIADIMPLCQWLAGTVAALFQAHTWQGKKGLLTERERQALRFVALGLSSKNASTYMGIAPKSVDFHVANGMKKLGATSRSHAVALAMSQGLFTID